VHGRNDGSGTDQSLESERRHGVHPVRRAALESRGEVALEELEVNKMRK